MRPDLKDLLVNTGRHHGDAWNSYRRGTRRSADLDDDYWNDTHETKARYDSSMGDRLAPLRRFLKANVGRPWRNVWEEICAVSDNRSVRGNHLRDHALRYVDNNGISKEGYYYWRYLGWSESLYVDDNGILRQTTKKHTKKSHRQVKNNFVRLDQKTKTAYCLTEHGWFYTHCLMSPSYSAVKVAGFDALATPQMRRYDFTQKFVDFIPEVASYMIQQSTDKPFRFVKDFNLVRKACWISASYGQCDKHEIRSIIDHLKQSWRSLAMFQRNYEQTG